MTAQADNLYRQAAARMNAGDLAVAERLLRELLQLTPGHLPAASALGVLMAQTNRAETGVRLTAVTIQREPNSFQFQLNHGFALQRLGRLGEALAACQNAFRLNPQCAPAATNVGTLAKDVGEIRTALDYYRKAIALEPTVLLHHSNYLFALHFDPAVSPEFVAAEHQRWGVEWAGRYMVGESREFVRRKPGARLIVGLVSPDLFDHPVGHFLGPLLEHFSREQFEFVVYSDAVAPDAVTERLRSRSTRWHDVRGLDDEAVARLVREDRVDVLLDLAGHTARNRQGVFALNPAPALVSYLGYPNSSGLPTVRHRLTDALADPPGLADELCHGRLWRLPETAWCYQGPDVAVAAEAKVRPVMFGSFNQLAKVSRVTIRMWAQILRRVPGAGLLLKARGLSDPWVREQVLARFKQEGIELGRIELEGWAVSREDHFRRYGSLDVALDTFPYHGTTTTCDALWMGVPVVVLAGRTHVSRVGVSLLTSVGLGDLIAQTEEEYVETAVRLAADSKARAHLRSNLRARMKASVLMDGPRFARNFEQVMREIAAGSAERFGLAEVWPRA